ncbi:hypothetical protein B0H63DRAFT_516405 [Podospora didyma]|uniref:RGS domain-containing protein n=1 Tax=Podospora didyma TaxID=330526 RepID=A0AAE0P4E9_9PEZI|nr:hypothetical protein B0H63DRAFT_516405 [Podospora didyma]
MGLLPLSYRRPSYVERPRSGGSQTTVQDDGGSDKIGIPLEPVKSTDSRGIPESLGFDKIMEGGTCPPITIRDFMNYLVYVERSAENLQFHLWYRDFIQRFNQATTADIALASEWTQTMEDEVTARIQKEHAEKMRKASKGTTADMFRGTDFEKDAAVVSTTSVSDQDNPFLTPIQSSHELDDFSDHAGSNDVSYRSQANEAFASVGVKAPFTIQPFRKEIDRVIAAYIMDGSPRQLNLSDREQKVVLHALAFTTHPSAFRHVAHAVESTLRRSSHPNFIRWSICNGNPARVFFARALGVGTIMLSFAAALILTMSRAGRGYRALVAIGWVIGIATLIAAYKGMCVVLHGMHHRHVRPWELFVAEGDDASEEAHEKHSFDSFGSANSYEEEPWVIRYQKRNVIRKIFDREVWIQEPALRQIQDTIFVQSMLCAIVLAGILTVVFVLVPSGGFF